MAKRQTPFNPNTAGADMPEAQPMMPKGLSGKLAAQRGGREDTINQLPASAGKKAPPFPVKTPKK
jgi:hypothetical protein